MRESEWTQRDYDNVELVYNTYCEEMFEGATMHIHKVFESNETLRTIQRIGHTDTHEVWDIQMFDAEQCYHIHFQFEVYIEEE